MGPYALTRERQSKHTFLSKLSTPVCTKFVYERCDQRQTTDSLSPPTPSNTWYALRQHCINILTSVADPDPVFLGHPDPDPVFLGHPDPDPDPGKYRIRILYPQKDPCILIFLFKYHCLKYSFVRIIFIFTFKCQKIIRFGKKMP